MPSLLDTILQRKLPLNQSVPFYQEAVGHCPVEALRLRFRWSHHPVYTMPDLLERIALDPAIRSGKPVIRGTRITVSDILEYLAGGMSETEILADFPDLDPDDIRAALMFAAERERRIFSVS